MNTETARDIQAYLRDLLELHRSQGFLTVDDILNYVDRQSLKIDDVDRLCEGVVANGVILLDEQPKSAFNTSGTGGHYVDRSHIDYDKIYRQVVKIDPYLSRYVEHIKQILPPQLHEESRIIQHAKEGNDIARERILTMYLKVALRIALWYHDRYALPLDETIQEANVGLVYALDKIKLDGTTRYSTYSTWWVRQNIDRKTQGVSPVFYRIPIHLKQKLFVVIKVVKKHVSSHGCTGDASCTSLLQDICTQLPLDSATATRYVDMISHPIGIHLLVNSESHELPSDNGATIRSVDDRVQIETSLAELSPREQSVLKLRYGLQDGYQRTLEEVGSELGVTRERIRQIESKALKQLRRRLTGQA